jgi:4-hydroxybenzoate polyprenyltransferase
MATTPGWRGRLRRPSQAPDETETSRADASGSTGYAARQARQAERDAARETPADVPTDAPADAPVEREATQTLVAEPEPEPEPETSPAPVTETSGPDEEPTVRLSDLLPFLLLRAAHPRQAVLTAAGLTIAAALAGRPGRELVLVLATVLVGQALLGWVNDLVDRERDARHATPGKPVADGRLDPGTLWFSVAVAVFVLVPLSVAHGVYAGVAYLASVAIGALGQWPALRRSVLSWVPWAAAFALYPAFLSYGGWGGQERGAPPEVLVTVLAAVVGIGVHLLTALWGLVADNEDGWRYLPLRLGVRIGAAKLLWVAVAWVAIALLATAYAASVVGLSQAPL